jgi:hypothetical protein
MPEIAEAPVGSLDPAQAAELSLLVDLEARWESLRKAVSSGLEVGPSREELQGKQKAYQAFHSLLTAYNRRYTPAHVPELLLNTPDRLGRWCRSMRLLYLQVEHHPGGHCPAHLLEKAYRWADRVADLMKTDRFSRSPPPGTIRATILSLEALGQWCVDLARARPTARRPGQGKQPRPQNR